MANLHDVAQKSGVSIATVSRVLNDDKSFSVSPATRKRVIKAASDLGYKNAKNTNINNQHLKIGIVQMHPETTLINDPYYHEAEKVMEKKQDEHQITLKKITTTSDHNFIYNDEAELDGIFAIGIFSEEDMKSLEQFSKNIVFVDHGPDDLKYYSAAPNFELVLKLSIEHFIQKGHKKIGYIGTKYSLDERKSNEIEYRRAYFESICKTFDMYNENFVIECQTNIQNGYDAMKNFIITANEIPTAFFISTDSVASGVIRAIIEAGLKIPDDISIITFNNTMLSEYALVPLTSIAVNIEDMIDAAYEDMRRLIAKKGKPQKTLVGCRLVERDSVADIS